MIKIGSLVELKSGSPNMTVLETVNGQIRCVWYENGQFKEYYFVEDALKPAQEYKIEFVDTPNP